MAQVSHIDRHNANEGILMVMASKYRKKEDFTVALTISKREISVIEFGDGIFKTLTASLQPVSVSKVLREARRYTKNTKKIDLILHTKDSTVRLQSLRNVDRVCVNVPTKLKLSQDELVLSATPVEYSLEDGTVIIRKNTTLPARVHLPVRGLKIFANGEPVKYDRRFARLCLYPFVLRGCKA